MEKKDFIFEVYNDKRSVFTLKDFALLLKESDYLKLKQKVNYYVKKKSLLNLRRGIYAKMDYSAEELACKIYTPAYISLDYVLQKAGIIFQFSQSLTQVSYLTRTIQVGNYSLTYQKIKNSILINTLGIERKTNGVNIALPERAILDTLYLNKNYHFDNLNGIDIELLKKIMPIYQSKQICRRVDQLL